MAFRNPLNSMGSLSALSLSANPVALPVIMTAAGVAITVAATVIVYKEYEAYEEKKHKEEMEKINRLHEKFLARIMIPGNNEIQGFPLIFKLSQDKNKTRVDSLHMTEEEIDDIGKNMPEDTDIALSNYQQFILDAILKLKEFYFSRSEKNDITAGVIAYLLYMLQTKCLSFAGYDYDIAYLNALIKFVDAYASLGSTENSQVFSRLNPVYSYLLSAKQELEKHKASLSLEEIIVELRDACKKNSEQLLRTFTTLIIKNKNWGFIKTSTMDELSNGLLRRQYVRTSIKGLVLRSDSEKKVCSSPFKSWTTTLASYYLKTLDPDSNLKKNEIFASNSLFINADLSKLLTLRKNRNLTKAEKIEKEKMELELKNTKKMFSECENFVTTKLDLNSKDARPKFTVVSNDNELIERRVAFINIATLIQKIISLQYLCSNLLKSIKQLGELYVESPYHFTLVFKVLDDLCTGVRESVGTNKTAIYEIQRSNNNVMQLEEKEQLPNQILSLLESTDATISRLGNLVKQYREKVAKNKNPAQPTVISVKNEMLEVVNIIRDMYNQTAEKPANNAITLTLNKPSPDTKPEPDIDLDSHESDDKVGQKVTLDNSDVDKKPEQHIEVAKLDPGKKPEQVVEAVNLDPGKKPEQNPEIKVAPHDATKLDRIKSTQDSIKKQLAVIQKNENLPSKQMEECFNLYLNLCALINKTQDLSKGKNERGYDATLDISTAILDLLTSEKNERGKNAEQLSRHLNDILSKKENSFIDDHPKLLYRVTTGLFASNTRDLIVDIKNSCDNIAKLLMVKDIAKPVVAKQL